MLDHALRLFRHSLGYDTARMAFEICFPRLGMAGGQTQDEEGQQMVGKYKVCILVNCDL